MTDFDFSSILIAKTDGDVCGPDGCLPGEEPAAKAEVAESNVGKDKATSAADRPKQA